MKQPNDSGESLPCLNRRLQEMLPAVLRVTGQLAGRLKGSEVLSASWHGNSAYYGFTACLWQLRFVTL